MEEVYIFRIIDDVVLDSDKFTMLFAKSKINCPRCIRCIEKAEKLLTHSPLVKHQDLPGVCDHCWRQLAKIQKLVQLAKKKMYIEAEGAALSAQMLTTTGIDEDQTKEPKEIKERPTTPRTPTSRTRIILEAKEGNIKSKKLTEELVRAKDKKSIAREDSPSLKDKKSKARDEILIKQEESLSTKYKKLTARDEKSIAQKETLRTKDKQSKARDEKTATQEEVLKTKDKVSKAIAQEEALRTKDKGSKARDDKTTTQEDVLNTKDKVSKAIAQEEALRTKDKGSKARDDRITTQEEVLKTKDKVSKAIAQEEPLRTKDKGSKARDDKTTTQEEVLKTKDKVSKAIAQEEALRTKDKGSKARDVKTTTQEEVLKTKDKVSKPRNDKTTTQEEVLKTKDKVSKAIAQEEALRTKDKGSKARDNKSIPQEETLKTKDKVSKTIAQEEALTTNDKGSKARDNKSITLKEALKTKDKESKGIAQDEALRTKNKGSKARDDKSLKQEEALKTKDKESKAVGQEVELRTKDKGSKTIAQKEVLSTKDKESKARDDKSMKQEEALITKAIAQEDALRTKDKGSKARDDKSIAQEEAIKKEDKRSKTRAEKPKTLGELLTTTDEKSKAKDEKSVAQEERLKDKDKRSKVTHEKPKGDEESLAAKDEKSEAKNQKQLRVTSSATLFKIQIAQEKLRREKEKLEADNIRKQQEEARKLLELAEKMAKEAVVTLEKENKAKNIVLPVSDSEETMMLDHEHAVHKALVISEIIIGEKICNHTRQDKDEDLETAEKISTQKLEKCRNAPVLESETPDKKPVDGAKKGAVVESEKTEKVTFEGSDKHEKTKRKSIQDSKKAKSTKSAIDPIQNKKEDCTIRYSLSDRTFIDKGWTLLPLEKVVRKMNVYRMRPSKPEFDWFERHKNQVLEYDSGERLAEVDGAGRGRWYYRGGALAMDYYDAEETNVGRRFVVYSCGAPDDRSRPRPRTVLATFDHLGNGIVYDHAGNTRLKYNQTEGVVLDREIGPVSRWKWHSLNDRPVLHQVMVDTQLDYQDPGIAVLGPAEHPKPDDEAMLSIELGNHVKEKSKKSSQNFKPFQIKMKALKINEHFSLRVLDQASVYLSYRDGSTNLKINIGMLLDHKEIVDTDTSDIDKVSNKMEKLPAHTASIAGLQKSVAQARARAAAERARLAGCPEGRLDDIESVDALHVAISRPPRTPLITCSASATHDTPELHKPCSCDLYCKPLF